MLFESNRLILRRVFRARVEGLEHLPAEGPLLITPNHGSFLDPLAIGAVLSWQHLRRVYWAGWTGILFNGPCGRIFRRATQTIPVDPERGRTSTDGILSPGSGRKHTNSRLGVVSAMRSNQSATR